MTEVVSCKTCNGNGVTLTGYMAGTPCINCFGSGGAKIEGQMTEVEILRAEVRAALIVWNAHSEDPEEHAAIRKLETAISAPAGKVDHPGVKPMGLCKSQSGMGLHSEGPECVDWFEVSTSTPVLKASCETHGDEWIKGSICPCGGPRVYHTGLGSTTTDEHWKCLACGAEGYADGIDA